MKYSYSEHARLVAEERKIADEMISACIQAPDVVERVEDGTVHYCKRFEDADGRWLRVVINPDHDPELLVTVFFDRRLRREHDNKDR